MVKAGPRSRVFADVQIPGNVRLTDVLNGVTSFIDIPQGFVSGITHTFNDVVVPGFKSLSAKGFIINNPMSSHKATRQAGGGSFTATGTNYTRTFSGNGSLTLVEIPYGTFINAPNRSDLSKLDTASLNSRARLTALSEIDSTPYAFMEDAAEFHSTLSLLKNPLQSALALARTFNSDYAKRRKKGVPHVKALADAWLVYRYGFRPIMYSIANVEKVFSGMNFTAPPLRRTSRGKARDAVKTQGSYSKNMGVGSTDTYVFADEVSFEATAGILYEMSSPYMNTPELLGFRAKDIPTTAYQLMPYSWVLDRFVDLTKVSKALMNLSDPKVKILAAWTTTNAQHITVDQWVAATRPTVSISVTGDQVVSTTVDKTRSVWYPSVADAAPVFNPRIDAAFTLDLASLILQRLKIGSFSSR